FLKPFNVAIPTAPWSIPSARWERFVKFVKKRGRSWSSIFPWDLVILMAMPGLRNWWFSGPGKLQTPELVQFPWLIRLGWQVRNSYSRLLQLLLKRCRKSESAFTCMPKQRIAKRNWKPLTRQAAEGLTVP